MTRVVINTCYGGFGLSNAAIKLYGELSGLTLISKKSAYGDYTDWFIESNGEQRPFHDDKISRDDPILVRVVEKLGEKSFGLFSKLKVVNVPDKINWHIDVYDGNERLIY